MKTVIIFSTMFITSIILNAQTSDKTTCNCPEPTELQWSKLCNSIYAKKAPNEESGLPFKMDEDLWEMSCAIPGVDSMEEASRKIQCMWMKYRTKSKCTFFSGLSRPEGLILSFSMDVGFPSFLKRITKHYKLDLNFIDPVWGDTVMDFLKWQEGNYRGTYEEKANEFLKMYEYLRKNGAKHSYEL
jgi:hypothetical protein